MKTTALILLVAISMSSCRATGRGIMKGSLCAMEAGCAPHEKLSDSNCSGKAVLYPVTYPLAMATAMVVFPIATVGFIMTGDN